MHLRPFPADETFIQRFLDEVWLPYHRDLEAAVAAHDLPDDIDEVAPREERVDFWLDNLEAEGFRGWIAVEGTPGDEGSQPLADVDAELVGFVTTEVDEAPDVFDRPDRLTIGDLYVAEPYRGDGLAYDLVDRAVEAARDQNCPEVVLDVDVDNERALAFYEKLGFEPLRHMMRVPTAELDAAVDRSQ